MLTDREIACAARQLLADELADLSPSEDLLATVRARHARIRKTRRASAAALAAVAYILRSGDSISLYLPCPGPARVYLLDGQAFIAGNRAVLVITAQRFGEAQLLQAAFEVGPEG